jgi:antitoxin component YwqK of YwqJK toxin-antitoxin module
MPALLCSLSILFLFSACRLEVVKIITTEGRVEGKYKQIRKTELRHGYYRLFHENGKLALEMFYQNGKLEGVTKTWYPNGQMESIANATNDSYEGPFKYWYITDTLKQVGTYINNDIEGNLNTYYANGVLKETVFFSKMASSKKRAIL